MGSWKIMPIAHRSHVPAATAGCARHRRCRKDLSGDMHVAGAPITARLVSDLPEPDRHKSCAFSRANGQGYSFHQGHGSGALTKADAHVVQLEDGIARLSQAD